MSRLSCGPLLMVLSLAAIEAEAQLTLNPARPITHNLYVQPIISMQSASEGGAIATFFGDSLLQAEIEGYIDEMWAQAGIDVTFLSPVYYESSFAYDGHPADYSGTDRPYSDMTPMFTTGPVHSDPRVLNMFFLNVVPGFSQQGIYTANGLSFLDRNGVAVYVGEGLLVPGWTLGLQAISSVVAHEIGHSLGVDHLVESQNLMEVGHTGHRISSAQIATIFTDDIGIDGYDMLVAVPEPTTGAMGIAALGLALFRRRRLKES